MADINARLKVTIKKDTKLWDKMVKNLSNRTGSVAQVGWWGDRNKEGIPIAQIASWNEEGHVNGGMFSGTITPPRPFIRVNFINKLKKDEWYKKYYKDIHNIAIGKFTWNKLHAAMGEELQKRLQEAILEFKSPPNSPATIALKGFNDPLIESGKMYDTVKFRVGRRMRR